MINQLVEKLLRRPIAYHRIFAEVAGGVSSGVFLSQCYYWSFRTNDDDGWFYKTGEEWHEETALNRREQESARKQLKALGILEERKEGVPCRLYFRLDRERLYEVIVQVTTVPVQTSLPDVTNQFVQSDKPVCTNVQTSLYESAKHTIYTENTSENTRDYQHKDTHASATPSFDLKATEPEKATGNSEPITSPQSSDSDKDKTGSSVEKKSSLEANTSGVFDKTEQTKYQEIESLEGIPLLPNGKKHLPWENPGKSLNQKYDELFCQWLYETHLKRWGTGAFNKNGYMPNKNAIRCFLLKAHGDAIRLERVVDFWNEFCGTMTSQSSTGNAPQKEKATSTALDALLAGCGDKIRGIILNASFTQEELAYIAELWQTCDRKEELTILMMKEEKLI